MSVPHYETAYGDTLADSLAVEFGEDLAAALVSGTALTPAVSDAVRAAAAAARREREEFLDVLDREADSLGDAADAVAAVESEFDSLRDSLDERPPSDRSFDELHDLWKSLRDLEAQADGIGFRRQETIRSHRNDLPGVPTDLTEYLYADLPASYPALASVADLADRLTSSRRRVERALASPR
jgi:hypothetical protein